MSERETKDFQTPGGHVVVFNAYLTGREAQELKSVMFAALKVNMDDVQSGKVGIGEVPSAFLVEQEKKAMSFLVVSVDGDSITPVDKLLDLPSSEYAAVVAEINKIQNPTTPEKSEQPGADTSQTAS
jgi:hypothetical protein